LEVEFEEKLEDLEEDVELEVNRDFCCFFVAEASPLFRFLGFVSSNDGEGGEELKSMTEVNEVVPV